MNSSSVTAWTAHGEGIRPGTQKASQGSQDRKGKVAELWQHPIRQISEELRLYNLL
jgi:hypothetical protein